MSPQLTLQTPLQIPPSEIPSYLKQLWSKGPIGNKGANTFCLLIWQPAWLEQELVRTGRIKGPITGTQPQSLIDAARQVILDKDLPHSTPPLDPKITACLKQCQGDISQQDLRGQHIDTSISTLKPRRLITLAPTLRTGQPLETLVAAYCPLSEDSDKSACGDVVVLRGGQNSIDNGLQILPTLLPKDLPSWLWWNGNLDEAQNLFEELATPNRRLIIDTSLGEPANCLSLLDKKVVGDQAINDLNWLRLRSWRESLAEVFDPPHRRESLNTITSLDIDVEGDHPVQGLLLAAWIASRLSWEVMETSLDSGELLKATFKRPDGGIVSLRLIALPVGNPSIHPGQIVGMRMICELEQVKHSALCVILGSKTSECMRLEAGGMASMELIEEMVSNQIDSVEMDVARLLESSRGTTSPLLAAAAPIASKLYSTSHV